MPRRPEIGNVQLYPNRPLQKRDKNGYQLKFYCPIQRTRIRKNCGTRDRREARRVQRECQERLLNGEYVRSGGAITEQQALLMGIIPRPLTSDTEAGPAGKTWQECFERYAEHRRTRIRESSLVHALSRINIAERIFEAYREDRGLSEGLIVSEVMTLDMLEYLQDRLLAGDECRYEVRSPNTVNSMMKAIMTFVRFCFEREWIVKMPPVKMLEVDEVMKGRPVTGEEFDRMLEVTPRVVGDAAAADWQFVLHVLWESGFRVGDLLDFSWDDDRHIHAVWPTRSGQYPTIVIPSSQKNGRLQEIPMLPGLLTLLERVPEGERNGWVVNPRSTRFERKTSRLTKDRISRIVAMIGREAGIIVRKADPRTQTREKFASAHDLRRGCAQRLINAGISAESLKVIMRHKDFATTEKHYGAIRSAQAAATEVAAKMSHPENSPIDGGIGGGTKKSPQLSAEEISKLKSLLNSL